MNWLFIGKTIPYSETVLLMWSEYTFLQGELSSVVSTPLDSITLHLGFFILLIFRPVFSSWACVVFDSHLASMRYPISSVSRTSACIELHHKWLCQLLNWWWQPLLDGSCQLLFYLPCLCSSLFVVLTDLDVVPVLKTFTLTKLIMNMNNILPQKHTVSKCSMVDYNWTEKIFRSEYFIQIVLLLECLKIHCPSMQSLQ